MKLMRNTLENERKQVDLVMKQKQKQLQARAKIDIFDIEKEIEQNNILKE